MRSINWWFLIGVGSMMGAAFVAFETAWYIGLPFAAASVLCIRQADLLSKKWEAESCRPTSE
jgi:hypothetical protein